MNAAQLTEALFRRRMAITQADALMRQAEANMVTLMAAERSPELKAYAALLAGQSQALMAAADHILEQQVIAQ